MILMVVGAWPLMNHPHAAAYQPWLLGVLVLCGLLGGMGAAGAPLATTRLRRWLARAAMATALLGLVTLSFVVFTDALCQSLPTAPDGSCLRAATAPATEKG